MIYKELKTILYNSKEYNNMSIKYEESVPIFCTINNTLYILFLYYTVPLNTHIWLEDDILIDINTGEVKSYNIHLLLRELDVNKIIYKNFNIDDYRKHRNTYTVVFQNFFDIKNYKALIHQNSEIMHILGDDFYDNFIVMINAEFYLKERT